MRALTNKAWEDFVAWCQSRGLNPVPANPWTVAAYARALEPRHRPAAIRKRIEELARIHETKTRKRLDRHPLVQRTLAMIERRADAARQDAGLFEDDDFMAADEPTRKAARRAKPTPKAPAKRPSRTTLSGEPRLVHRRKLKR